jgi:hypothetical protein
MTEMGKELA